MYFAFVSLIFADFVIRSFWLMRGCTRARRKPCGERKFLDALIRFEIGSTLFAVLRSNLYHSCIDCKRVGERVNSSEGIFRSDDGGR